MFRCCRGLPRIFIAGQPRTEQYLHGEHVILHMTLIRWCRSPLEALQAVAIPVSATSRRHIEHILNADPLPSRLPLGDQRLVLWMIDVGGVVRLTGEAHVQANIVVAVDALAAPGIERLAAGVGDDHGQSAKIVIAFGNQFAGIGGILEFDEHEVIDGCRSPGRGRRGARGSSDFGGSCRHAPGTGGMAAGHGTVRRKCEQDEDRCDVMNAWRHG